jgi:hypothetical protein
MEIKTQSLPQGILVQWTPVELAANYHITLTDPDGWLMCKRSAERDEFYLVFNNLISYRSVYYSILVEASNRSGEVIDNVVGRGTPIGHYYTKEINNYLY